MDIPGLALISIELARAWPTTRTMSWQSHHRSPRRRSTWDASSKVGPHPRLAPWAVIEFAYLGVLCVSRSRQRAQVCREHGG